MTTEMGSGFNKVNWPKRQHPYQSLPYMAAQGAEGTGAHHTHQYLAPYSEDRRDRAPVEHSGQNGYPASTHSQHHVGFEGYSTEQPPSRAMNQDPRSFRENAVYPINGPSHICRTMESRHVPLMQVHNCTYCQDESVLNAYHDARIRQEVFQQTSMNFSNSVHGTANNAYDANLDTLSYLGAHVFEEDACGTPKSSSSDIRSRQYDGQEQEASIGATQYQERGSVSMTESTPGLRSSAQGGIVIQLDATNAEPWTVFGLVDDSQTSRSIRRIQEGMDRITLDATHSVFAYGNPSSVSSTRTGFETCLSSVIQLPNQIDDIPSAIPYFPPSSASGSQMDASDSYQSPLDVTYTSGSRTDPQNRHRLLMERAATLARAHGHLGRYPRSDPGCHLPIPGVRRPSSASSQITDATSSSAVPSSGQGVLKCGVDGCETTFSGRYGKGNRARHKKDCHGGKGPIICQDGNCGKVFRRSDARLKHHRKHHPHLVGRNTQVSRPRRWNLAPGDLDGDA
ncbi:hypothetical protein COCMIDRAFT_34963 [Bipolaris oryzae ATCC 44560]|uniref:C2H2-type domain-containing protein n=1 Tax=Bipolaris oryzae ATCC 44560 TaxID=930090 RepID=W6ZUS0_COCMI|nr:uncharacterized protein COCMIDRAFT_34963 [Bipolaris oryzae ATCC 44560]EUC47576.1 hypothetical protein COCMIDRAFT_34963 [Bipolaris oryzae ATCC 44560]